MTVVLDIAADRHRPALRVRPWLAADMPDLLAAMAREYPDRGLWSHPDVDVSGHQVWTGPRNDLEADLWLSGQERGWDRGDWLTFAVLDASQDKAVGHVRLKNRDGGQVGIGERGEISYWTAADARGRGIAPAAVRAVTAWAFSSFGAEGLPRVMLVHDVDDPASCRVAAKSGYPFREFSPANPPYWFTDGHIHLAEAVDYEYGVQRRRNSAQPLAPHSFEHGGRAHLALGILRLTARPSAQPTLVRTQHVLPANPSSAR
jgi:RimJ/RimL family protein N-acetyltransferase